jgi:dUTP pyrophosphatase
MKLGVHKCHPDAKMPFYATEGSACFDIAVVLEADVAVMEPGQTVVFGTGLKLDIPEGYQLKLHVRSSTGIKKSLMLANVTGIIDSDYVDELKVALYNRSGGAVPVLSGAVLAQAELQEVIQCDFEELEEAPLQKTSRNGGLGSTDKVEPPFIDNTEENPQGFYE